MSDEDLKTVEAMAKFGGSFMKALAAAAFRADPENLRRIKEAWPEYWTRYATMRDFPPLKPDVDPKPESEDTATEVREVSINTPRAWPCIRCGDITNNWVKIKNLDRVEIAVCHNCAAVEVMKNDPAPVQRIYQTPEGRDTLLLLQRRFEAAAEREGEIYNWAGVEAFKKCSLDCARAAAGETLPPPGQPWPEQETRPIPCPNCGTSVVEGAQVYNCEVCEKECCTACTETTAEHQIICEECEDRKRHSP